MDWKGKINFETRPQVTGDDVILTEKDGEINAETLKSTPADADVLLIEDSAASYAKKKVTVSSIKGVAVEDEGTPVTGTPHNSLNFIGTPVAATNAGGGVANITITPYVNVQDEGSPITGTPHTTLNFVGDQIAATNAGSGVATITVIPRPIIQVRRKNITTTVQTTTTIDYTTTPTSTSGAAFDNHSITMTGANTVRVQCLIPFDSNDDNGGAVALVYRGTTVLAVASQMVGRKSKAGSQICFDFYDTPGTGTITYYIRVGTFAGKTLSYNRLASDATPWGGTFYTNNCNITLTELVLA